MIEFEIKSLKDLDGFRSAPVLNSEISKILFDELVIYMNKADWFTIGIMAPSKEIACINLSEMTDYFDWKSVKIKDNFAQEGPVFLKANQKTGEAFVRIEYGLGEGILISCQKNESDAKNITFGPFPLGFFKTRFT